MSPLAVAIKIGGQTYRVRSQSDEQHLRRLAATVDSRLRQLCLPAHVSSTQHALLLVAISLAHDLAHERALRTRLQHQSTETLRSILGQLDHLLNVTLGNIADTTQKKPQSER